MTEFVLSEIVDRASWGGQHEYRGRITGRTFTSPRKYTVQNIETGTYEQNVEGEALTLVPQEEPVEHE